MVLVSFEGGPRSGQHKHYLRNPRQIGCADEWRAAGIPRGIYKISRDQTGAFLIARWVEV